MPQYGKGHDISGRFWTVADERVPSIAMHCSTSTNAPHLRCTALNRTTPRSLRVKLLHMYRLLLALSANQNCAYFTDRLCDIVFTELTSDQHAVLDIFQIPSGCFQNFSG